MNFDSYQQQAINALGKNVIVSASAGAGKTGVLVERLLKRNIIDRVPLDRILAMTFTKAAASEMKKRLATKLHERYENTEDEEEKAYLHDQLILLESAQITTIDSYCLSIIKKYCNVIGLDPATAENILDEGSSTILEKQAFFETIKSFDEDNHNVLLKVLEYFSPRSEDYDTLFNIIHKINENADASDDPKKWYKNARTLCQPVKRFQQLPEETRKSFYGALLLRLGRMENDIDRMYSYAKDDELIDPLSLSRKKNALYNCIAAIKEQESYELLRSSFTYFVEIPTDPSSKNQRYRSARDTLNRHAKEFGSLLFDQSVYISDHNDIYEIAVAITDLAENTKERFMMAKQKNACMDFSDMERYACMILDANDGSIAGFIRDQLDEIMVDEFQDTSELQNAIIEKISNGHNVFRVGDVKQSIYRFRKAKPDLMRGIMADPSVQQINFRYNYRSKQSIVDFSNMLFEKLMNIEGGKDTYLEDDIVSIGNEETQAEDPVPIEFAAIVLNEDETGEEEEESPDAKKVKARWIAQKIIELKKEDSSLKWNDFAVLVKAHADKPKLREAFDLYGIPYDIDAREGFYRSDLCLSVLGIVRTMLDHNDTTALVSVCTSELFQLSDEELALCRIGYHNLTDGVTQRHPDIFACIDALKKTALSDGVSAMLSQLAGTNHFYDRLPDSQKVNFDYLFETVNNTRMSDLYTFLETMEAGSDEKSSEAMSKGKDDDVVTVTTIHQSKGLQYGIVFLWCTSKNMFNDTKDPVMIEADGHYGITYKSFPYHNVRPSIDRIAAEYQSGLEDLEEFIRLLYVAVTRAVNRLFFVDVVKDSFLTGKISIPTLYERKGLTGLILTALEPSRLFQIHSILSSEIPSEVMPAPSSNTISEMPHFHKEVKTYGEVFTPSSLEMSVLPQLDFTPKNFGLRYGTRIHEAVASLPNRNWTRTDLQNLSLSIEAKQQLSEFSDSKLYQKCLSMEIHKEMPFYVKDGTNAITGIMDFVAMNENEIILIDFKTDHTSMTEIQNRYTDQLNAYRHALQLMYPEKIITAYAYSFHNGTWIEIKDSQSLFNA